MKHKSDEVFEVLKKAVDFLSSMSNLFDKTCEDMRHVDLQMSDILHELELTDFDKKKGNALANEIKEIQRERRIIKEDQAAFLYIRDFYENNATFTKRLKESVALMEKEINARANRIYTPRVRTDKMEPIYANKNMTKASTVSLDETAGDYGENVIQLEAL